MQRIAIFAALQWECVPALHCLKQVRRSRSGAFASWRATIGDFDVTVVKTGIGLTRAGEAARQLAAEQFDLFLSSGCAGALSSELCVGDLVVAESVRLDTGEISGASIEHRRQIFAAAQTAGLPVRSGHLLSSRVVVASASQKRDAALLGVIAADMEGAAIARAAADNGVPFASVRSILDAAETELDQSSGLVDPASGSIRPLAIATHLVRHPAALKQMLAMKKMMDTCRTSLDLFFAAYLKS